MRNLFDSPDEYSVSITLTDPSGQVVTINAHEEDASWPWMFEVFANALRGAGYVIDQGWTEVAVQLHRDMLAERVAK